MSGSTSNPPVPTLAGSATAATSGNQAQQIDLSSLVATLNALIQTMARTQKNITAALENLLNG